MTDHHGSRIFSLIFPDAPRDFPMRRWVRILMRTLHIITASILFGGHVFDQPVTELEPWLWGTVLSGMFIMLTDLHASFAVLLEVRGVAVVIKAILLVLVPLFWEERNLLLLTALIIGAVSSHMPKQYRHRLLFQNSRITTDMRSG